jgi:hypothetical protein
MSSVTLQTARTREATGVVGRARSDPGYAAYVLLRVGFTVLPILFGIDKFSNALVSWDKYLAPWIDRIMPGTAHEFMFFVGAVEIVAGLVVALKPRYGALLVSGWLAGIVINLFTYSGFYDVAMRDFGLMLAALTLARLARFYDPAWAAPRAAGRL